MVIELLSLVASYHFDREHEYNERNPGVIAAVGIQHTDYLRSYVTGGAYLDSLGELTPLAGVGVDLGKDYGVSVTIAHVHGSGVDRYLAVPVPSLFYRGDSHGLRVIVSPQVVAFGYTYTFTN